MLTISSVAFGDGTELLGELEVKLALELVPGLRAPTSAPIARLAWQQPSAATGGADGDESYRLAAGAWSTVMFPLRADADALAVFLEEAVRVSRAPFASAAQTLSRSSIAHSPLSRAIPHHRMRLSSPIAGRTARHDGA